MRKQGLGSGASGNGDEASAIWRRGLQDLSGPTPLWQDLSPGHGSGTPGPSASLTLSLSLPRPAASVLVQVAPRGWVAAAWGLLLGRYAREESVLFGLLSERPGVRPFRVDLQPEARVSTWLEDVARRLDAALGAAPVSPEWCREVSGWSTEQPIVETGLAFDGVRPGDSPRLDHPLQLSVVSSDSLELRFDYDSSRLDRWAVERVGAHLDVALQGLAADPSAPLSSVSLVADEERRALLAGWGTPLPAAGSRALHDLFADQARRTPSAVAVADPDERLTYGELNRRANRVAHRLRSRGVGPEVVVGLFMERSVDLIVAVLAILKAGGAYLPIDPSSPASRAALVLEDAEAPLLLTSSRSVDRLPPGAPPAVVLEEEIEKSPAEDDPVSGAGPDTLAYVIYTSGSTGKPKGVAVTHANVTRLFTATEHWIGFSESDVFSLFHSIAFDVSVFELWGALLHGGRLVVVPYAVSRAPEEFYELLVREQVTVLSQTPSAFRPLVRAEETVGQGDLALRLVIFAGEALELQSLRPWFERHGDQKPLLVNMYGITETTVHATWRPISMADVEAGRGSVIGVPIPDLRLCLLDPWLHPVPTGVVGEICVGGRGVARGYLRRPDLTRERFIPDPFSPEGAGERLYRSGDLARYLPDGELEYLGRMDHQVKVRGFRVELGEIQDVLGRHPAVRESVVVAQRDDAGEVRLVAYLVGPEEARPSVSALREHLLALLPDYMVPAAFVFLEALPRTVNDKVDTRSLPAPSRRRPDLDQPRVAPRDDLEKMLSRAFEAAIGVEGVGVHDRFLELGGTSLQATRLVAGLRRELGEAVPMVALFDAPTVAAMAQVLRTDYPRAVAGRLGEGASAGAAEAPSSGARRGRPDGSDDVAIVGMAGRFPQAPDIEQFWQNLVGGVEARREVAAADLVAAGLDPKLLDDPDYVASSFTLEEAECFDAAFFGYTPREAELMDPQQRLFLELAHAALEDAGYDCDRLGGRVGVFGGVGRNAYLINNLASHPELRGRLIEHSLQVGNERDFPGAHVAYKLGLGGPVVNVQTGCSTSGVAIHLACMSLRAGESDVALAGGCKVLVPTHAGYPYVEGGALSPDGRIRAFDARAGGMARGSGGALLVLKRLKDALADGDNVRAVVKGSAVNNDGAARAGFAAPGVAGQAAVIEAALDAAGVDADGLGYVETHGTGTILGDPIEIAGLTRAYRRTTSRTGFCAVGSVKTNVGHLDAAAAVAGVVKTVLALERETLPPSLNFTEANPEIPFEASPFFVNAALREWPRGDRPRRAGVSSFGLGGTNSHIVLEEAPSPGPRDPDQGSHLLLLSARTRSGLDAACERLADRLEGSPDLAVSDVSYTLATGRRGLAFRRTAVVGDRADAVRVLRGGEPGRALSGEARGGAMPAVFLFPGGGTQYVGMGQGLHDGEGVFRDALDRCAGLLEPILGQDVRDVVFGGRGDIERPSLALPALFATEYALAALWQSWGVTPIAMIGHSMGEYTAACLSGVLSLESALALVACRGRLFETLPEGGMLSVPLSVADVRERMDEGLDIAAVNRPEQCVVSGTTTGIARLQESLAARGVECRRIHIAVAAHSRLVEPILDEFRDFLGTIEFGPVSVPWVSNVTGTWIEEADARSPEYWVEHLRRTVRFSDGLAAVFAEGDRALVEVGPGQTLSTFALQHPAGPSGVVAVPSLHHPREEAEDVAFVLRSLGRLWLNGVAVDWKGLFAGQSRRRVSLPTYPFERKRFWIDPAPAAPAPGPAAVVPASAPVAPDAPSPPAEPAGGLAESVAAPRLDRIRDELKCILEELSGIAAASLDEHATFLELGFDSLFLAQATSSVRKTFGIKVPVRKLIESTPSLAALAAHLDGELPPEAFPPPAAAALVPVPAAPGSGTLTPVAPLPGDTPLVAPQGATAVERLILEQLQAMQQQLQRLRGGASVPASGPATLPAAIPGVPVAGARDSGREAPWRAIGKADRAVDGSLTEAQEQHIDALVERVCARAPSSRSWVARHRPRLADPRTVQGFKRRWKEMVFPMVAARTAGSRMWDIDGNEYIDLVNGYGVTLLGHSPEFVTRAVKEQLDRGVEIGPQHYLVGEVADLVCELTGMERAALCNTGSEAVLAAIRVARTVTGKDRIATFQGHYHGIFNEVLIKGVEAGGTIRPLPIAPGIPRRAVDDAIVMKMGDPRSFDTLREHADEIAVVMLEPVRSRNPDFQPVEFIRELRAVTEELGIPLMFDEMITGFRCHPGGAQAHFGVRADLATYGKVIGGGYPIGIVTGRALYLDALDGGQWQYGDDSVPEADMTWFAGTFVRHPVAMAAAHATLTYLKEQGPGLQEGLNQRTARFVEDLNAHFQDTGAPIWIEHFSSMFLVKFVPFQEHSQLLFYHLHNRGIFTYEGRPSYFTTAHTDEDIARVATAFKESVAALQEVHLFPGTPDTGVSRELPLSEGQQEIWLATRLDPDASRAYNLCSTLKLQGPLDLDLLRRAALQLVRRHEALRCVPNDDGETQRVLPVSEVDVPLVDLSGLDETARRERLDALEQAEVRTELDLLEGPLYRFQVVRLANDQHELLITVHHIVADGWSCGVLMRDLGRLYAALANGRPHDLPEPLAYSEWIEGLKADAATRSANEEYWLQQFSDGVPTLELPTDRPRPPEKTYPARRENLRLDGDLVKRVRAMAGRHRSTFFAAVLATFHALLHRISGQADLVVGFSLAGQASVEDRDLVGHCVNFLPLRARIDAGQAFGDYLKALGGTVLDATDHQDFTFGTLIKRLRIPRDPGRPPLISVAFNLDPSSRGVEFAGLQCEAGSVPRQFENFDIFFNLVERADHIEVQCTYNAHLWEPGTMRRRLEEYRTLLEAVAAHPGLSMGSLPLMPEAARHAVLVDWNDTARDYGRPLCLHELVEEQIARTPDAVAVEAEGEILTYGELGGRARRLARALRRRGLQRGGRVGILAERSLEMVVGLLGTLEAGAAWVPLDPDYPADRLGLMLEDAGVDALLAQERFVPLAAGCATEVLLLDGPGSDDATASESPEPLAESGDPGDTAYVIYTSGSTGKPKGAMNAHRGIVNRLQWMQEQFGLTAGDRVLQKTPFSFDVSVWELFWPLVSGARLVMARPGGHRDPAYLKDTIRDRGITTIHFVPSMLQAFLDEEAGLEECVSLKRVVCSGEALSAELRDRFFAHLGCELHNLYGPTEAAVDVTHWECRREDRRRVVPIGRPIANTRAYVLDEGLGPVPIGVPGELHIGGVQVGQGYLGRPELTARRFIDDPFSDDPGARLYRTGDRARWLDDGSLEYLGRLDHQVKVRGFRIEPGEIESFLEREDGVSQAVVVAREVGPGDTRLVAYVVRDRGEGPTAGDLRTRLRASLPDHMVPSSFAFLDALPLTPSGKVDRRALPSLETLRAPSVARQQPGTANERLVADLWGELLGVEEVRPGDNFFDLGGHSLLALRAITGIERKTGLRLNPRDLLFQTLEQIAQVLDQAGEATDLPPTSTEPPPRGGLQGLVRSLRSLAGNGR